jgi:Mg/Co/Ni transporter MgtE
MADTSEDNSVLRAAIDGIARVAEAIDDIPEDQQKRALEAAESSYRQTVRELNYPEDVANSWVTAMMYTLTAEVEKISQARRDNPDTTPRQNRPRDRS